MADRRRQIAALRAKAASTTFPAEAEACRAKADELAALEPAPARADSGIGAVNDFMRQWATAHDTPTETQFSFRTGDLFDAAGGVRVRVTNVAGNTYTIWVE